MKFFDAAGTAQLLDYRALVDSLKTVLLEYDRGQIECPQRLVVRCGHSDGLLLSMPSNAADLAVHKLLTIFASNPSRGMPAIQGNVTAYRAEDGKPLICLDGPTVTGRRTAGITIIGMQQLCLEPPRSILIIGTGVQAKNHVEAIRVFYPDAQLRIQGRSSEKEVAFCDHWSSGVGPASSIRTDSIDVVIAVTTSKTPVYNEPGQSARLVIGVGAYRLDMIEIGSKLINSSKVYVDDPVGAPEEAGDLAAAGIAWQNVSSLASALTEKPDHSHPIFFKSVGCSAWDLAACRAALARS
jgi:1-piperideine-2-carboxylate/1-pyrroline-2-carboxylate reductase [NAD(P)H]